MDNEVRLSDWLRDELERRFGITLHPSVPNVHANGVAERTNRRVRAALDKWGVQRPADLPRALEEVLRSLNESPTQRLRWGAPVEVKALPPAEQRELAEWVRAHKALDSENRRHRTRRSRSPLPDGPAPYMVRSLKGAHPHPRYEGPFVGVPCTVPPPPNCRSPQPPPPGPPHPPQPLAAATTATTTHGANADVTV